jgi:4-amino-4-deoxy-L-arabinose transferase-like glycosyltransferase
MNSTPWRFALLLCVLLGALGLHHGLWTPDEPREAEISREMALAPTVIPTLNGHRFIEKPPLYYWLVGGLYRAMGHPSADAARAVSALAGLLTLLCVYLWSTRAGQRRAGLIAALMLATSQQFLVSTHWVLLDPLLMLWTTLATWAAWELLGGKSAPRAWGALLYGALALALWTKGLIGVVLLVAGVTVAVAVGRLQWRRLHPLGAMLFLAVMVLLLGAAIWAEGGRDALWEWAWVNHVQRFTNPGATGHRQPLLYYLWMLPFAALPWLVPLFDGLRRSAWRADAPAAALQRYCALLVATMLLVLSASATKRETYLLPLLPLLFLWMGLRVAAWLDAWEAQTTSGLGWRWWTQFALLALFASAPAAAALVYLRRADALALALLACGVAMIALALAAALRARRRLAGRAALGCAWVGAAALLLLLPPVIDQSKDMAPFVRWLDGRLPAGAPVPVLNSDETLDAIVPFVSGRSVIALDAADAAHAGRSVDWLLVQDKTRGVSTPVPPGYVLERRVTFGRDRTLSLWRCAFRCAALPASAP